MEKKWSEGKRNGRGEEKKWAQAGGKEMARGEEKKWLDGEERKWHRDGGIPTSDQKVTAVAGSNPLGGRSLWGPFLARAW